MRQEHLLFTMRLNKARHDRTFQAFLAKVFGERYIAREGTKGMVIYRWRGIVYVVQELDGLPFVPLPGTLERLDADAQLPQQPSK